MIKIGCKILMLTVLFSMFFTNNIEAQEGVVAVNQDKNIERLLHLKKEVNRTLINYKIQIFNGNRVGALKTQTEFRKVFSAWNPTMKYQTPNYKIWVGNFKTRIEADRALLIIKKEFRNAFIFKPKKQG